MWRPRTNETATLRARTTRKRCQGVVVEPRPGLEESGEGLLHQILDDLWVPDTSSHHAPDQRSER